MSTKFSLKQPTYNVLEYVVKAKAAVAPAQIASALGRTNGAIMQALLVLKKQGLVSRAGYGMYEARSNVNLKDIEVKPYGSGATAKPKSKGGSLKEEIKQGINDFLGLLARIEDAIMSPEDIAEFQRLKKQEEDILKAMPQMMAKASRKK